MSHPRPRVGAEERWMRIAYEMSRSSSCTRLHVGCVVVASDNVRVLSIGYNGDYSGGPNTCRYPEAEGACGCLHAEDNAIAHCNNWEKDKIVYLTHAPCYTCAQRLINSSVSKVYYYYNYRIMDGEDLLRSVGIECMALAMENPPPM